MNDLCGMSFLKLDDGRTDAKEIMGMQADKTQSVNVVQFAYILWGFSCMYLSGAWERQTKSNAILSFVR